MSYINSSSHKRLSWKNFSWRSLDEELALWSVEGRKASFWWRDDDACASTPELERLLQLSEEFSVPISLSVVPARLDNSLCKRLVEHHRISILQHGYAHSSHAPADEKKSEYGAHRPVAEMQNELAQGKKTLQRGFSDQFYPVLVPPWNRYTPTLLPHLAGTGYTGISAMWARVDGQGSGRLFKQTGSMQIRATQTGDSHSGTQPVMPLQVNTHIDPVAWRRDRGFIGESDALEQLVCHLRFRREFPQRGDEPTGLLTHHIDQTETVWAFCQQLAEKIDQCDNCIWLSAGDIWSRQPATSIT